VVGVAAVGDQGVLTAPESGRDDTGEIVVEVAGADVDNAPVVLVVLGLVL
jgi:hypothetical protein